MPPRLSLPEQLHRILTTTNLGWWWDFGQLLATLVSCSIYVFSTYVDVDKLTLSLLQEKTVEYLEWVTVLFFIVDLFLRWVSSSHPAMYPFQMTPLIDVAQIVPTLVELIVKTGINNTTSRILRIFRIIRVFRVLRFFRLIQNFSTIRKQAMRVSLVIFSVVFILAGLMQLIESELGASMLGHSESPVNFDFGSAFYFGIITVATVGYGDIFPVTELGKAVVCVFILICLFVVPREINKFAGK